MNSRKDCDFKTKFISGRKKWAKKFVRRYARRTYVICVNA